MSHIIPNLFFIGDFFICQKPLDIDDKVIEFKNNCIFELPLYWKLPFS